MSRSKVWAVIGPPGTGKTTYVVKQVNRAVKAWCERTGYGPEHCTSILVSTLTKGAVAELHGRDMVLPKRQVSTLHSLALRAIGVPELCVDKHKQFAADHPNNREYWWSGERGEPGDDGDTSNGDRLLQEYHRLRACMIERDYWEPGILQFAVIYEEWKQKHDWIDFSDVMHIAIARVPDAPGGARLLFIDEAQDHDKTELTLVRQWSRSCEQVVLIGDPDQCLYEFRGSQPEGMLEGVPDEQIKVLAKSYRCPYSVQEYAGSIIYRVSTRRSFEWHGRDVAGDVSHSSYSLSSPRLACDVVQYAEMGTVMVLASCTYMLTPLAKALRLEGVPYWNPYSEKSKFRPLHPHKGRAITNRVLGFLRISPVAYGDEARLWTCAELKNFTDMIGHGALKHGAKAAITRLKDEGLVTLEQIREWFTEDAIEHLDRLDEDPNPVGWLVRYALKHKLDQLEYCRNIYLRHGKDGLLDNPKVILSTIHGAKGTESDTVLVSPDISYRFAQQFDLDPDPLYRMFYVAATRAKERLVLLASNPNSPRLEF